MGRKVIRRHASANSRKGMEFFFVPLQYWLQLKEARTQKTQKRLPTRTYIHTCKYMARNHQTFKRSYRHACMYAQVNGHTCCQLNQAESAGIEIAFFAYQLFGFCLNREIVDDDVLLYSNCAIPRACIYFCVLVRACVLAYMCMHVCMHVRLDSRNRSKNDGTIITVNGLPKGWPHLEHNCFQLRARWVIVKVGKEKLPGRCETENTNTKNHE